MGIAIALVSIRKKADGARTASTKHSIMRIARKLFIEQPQTFFGQPDRFSRVDLP